MGNLNQHNLNMRNATGLNTRTAAGVAEMDGLAGRMAEKMREIDALVARYTEQLKQGSELPAETKTMLEKNAADVAAMSGRMLDLEQSLQAGIRTQQDAETVGAVIARNTEFVKQAGDILANRSRDTVTIRLNCRNTLTLTAIGADIKTINPAQGMPVIQRPLSVLDYIPWADTTMPLITTLRESAANFLADIVAEGALKPESGLTFGPIDIKAVTIAHWIKASNQLLADMPLFEAYITGRMAYGVRLRLEYLVINGTGDIKGIMATGNHVVADAEPSAIDTINKSKARAWMSFLPPEVIILHPLDWSDIERIKGTDGHYIFGIPNGAANPMLWSLPVIQSPAMPQGKHWVGNLSQSTQGYIRQDVDVSLSTEDGDNFVKNLVTVRAEGRFGFAVLMPDAGVGGALIGAAGVSVDP